MKSSSQPEAVEKETLPLCLLLCADHRQRCFTRGFLVVVGFFFFFLEISGFLWQGKGRKKPPLEQFHGQCFNYKTCSCLLLFQRQCERSRGTCSCQASSPVVSGRRLTRSQGAKTCVRIQKTPTHDLWQFVVIVHSRQFSTLLDPGLKTST